MMNNAEVLRIAKTAAHKIKTSRNDHLRQLGVPDLFFRSFGWYKWSKKNELSDEQVALYKKTYIEAYHGKKEK